MFCKWPSNFWIWCNFQLQLEILFVDYMERDSARGAIQPGLNILAWYSQTGLWFSARPNGPENLKESHVIETGFQPGP